MAAQWRMELVQVSDESGSNDIIELIDSPSDSHNIIKFGEDHAEEEFSQHNVQSGQETAILVGRLVCKLYFLPKWRLSVQPNSPN